MNNCWPFLITKKETRLTLNDRILSSSHGDWSMSVAAALIASHGKGGLTNLW